MEYDNNNNAGERERDSDDDDGGFQYKFNFFKRKKIDEDDYNLQMTVYENQQDDRHNPYSRLAQGGENETDMKKVRSSFTCLVAGDLKRVEPENLQGRYMCQLTDEDVKAEDKRRNKCKVYYLMTSASVEELNQYIDLVLMSFKIDHVYPFDNAWTEKFDRELAATNLDHIRKTNNVVLKRAFIWLGLYLSRKFLSVFCPRPEDNMESSGSPSTEHAFNRYTKEFTANPVLLGPFVMSKDSPFACVVSARLVGLLTVSQFVTIATKLWIERQPWKDHDSWGMLDADDIGHDVKLLMAPPPALKGHEDSVTKTRLLK